MTRLDQFVPVGRSGLFVSHIGLGTMQFGWSIDEAASIEVLDAYRELGGNFLDTADIYSVWSSRMGGPDNPGGVSEEIIGRWIKARGCRDETVVATKVRGAMGREFSEGRDTVHQREGLSRKWILRACEDSLRRLQVDHIDLYQAHAYDRFVPIEETMGVFDELVTRGWVRYLGCSNFSAWRIAQADAACERHGLARFVSLQPQYSLLDPIRGDVERELAPACQAYGLGILPYSPLGAGMLTGKYRRGASLPESVRAQEIEEDRFTDKNWDIVETVIDVAERNGRSPASVAIGWQLAKPFVTAPIIGANSPEQLHDTLRGLDDPLPDADLAALDEVSAFRSPRYATDD